MNIRYLILAVTLIAVDVSAGNSTLDAAIGGGIGGATGAAIGNEIGGRDGAILGGALGGGVGAAIATDESPRHKSRDNETRYRSDNDYKSDNYRYKHNSSKFCPPGQAKKGRC